jgi:hypothetical protein
MSPLPVGRLKERLRRLPATAQAMALWMAPPTGTPARGAEMLAR